MLCAALIGAAGSVHGISVQTLVQSAADPAMRGRMLSLWGMITRACPALGALVLGRPGRGVRAAAADLRGDAAGARRAGLGAAAAAGDGPGAGGPAGGTRHRKIGQPSLPGPPRRSRQCAKAAPAAGAADPEGIAGTPARRGAGRAAGGLPAGAGQPRLGAERTARTRLRPGIRLRGARGPGPGRRRATRPGSSPARAMAPKSACSARMKASVSAGVVSRGARAEFAEPGDDRRLLQRLVDHLRSAAGSPRAACPSAP